MAGICTMRLNICTHNIVRNSDVTRSGSRSQPASLRKTTDAANVEGLVAPEAWPGLGELPPDLPADFRTHPDF
jgi:hypothetical protein